MLNKDISEDRRLSWAARGLLIFLLGKPDNWEVSVAHLSKETSGTVKPSKRDAVYGLLRELEQAGYVRRENARTEGGVFSGIDYLISEAPLTDSPLTDLPCTVNPTLISTEE